MTAPVLVSADDRRRPPVLARALGFAGLLPQIWALTILLYGNREDAFSALALSYAYAALILSFVGGLWWGLAAQAGRAVPGWVWVAAIAPSLVALVSALPWAFGAAWPGPSLGLLGVALVAAPAVDLRLARLGLAPRWWLGLRVPLSLGLGILTLAIGYVA